MKNSNVIRLTCALKDIRKWLEYAIPGNDPRGQRKQDLDDLVQGVCLIAVTKLGVIPEDLGEATVRAWLRKVCRFVAMKHRYNLFVAVERCGRRDIVELELPAYQSPPSEDSLRQIVRSVVRRLNPQQRVILRMWIDGRSRHEIAEALGISVTTVFERRKEIIARFKEHEENRLGIIPVGVLQSQQVHPVAWTMGILTTLAAIAAILWLVGWGDGSGESTPTLPILAESPPAEPDDARGGAARRPSAPLPSPSPTAVAVAALVVETTSPPQVDADDGPSVSIPTGSKKDVRPSPRYRPGKARKGVGVHPSGAEPAGARSQSLPEIDLLRKARTTLGRGAHEDALKIIQLHKVDYPKSTLAPDRMRLEHAVLCALGRVQDASIVESVLRTYHDPGPLRCTALKPTESDNHRTHTR